MPAGPPEETNLVVHTARGSPSPGEADEGDKYHLLARVPRAELATGVEVPRTGPLTKQAFMNWFALH